MKKSVLLKFLLACSLPLVVLSACKEPEPVIQEHYIRLSDAVVSLPGSADQPATVRVYAVPQWDASTTIPWLKVTNQTPNSFDIVATESDETEIRTGSVTVKAGDQERTITVKQVPKDHVFHRFHLNEFFQLGTVMSASGKYAGGIWWRDGAAGERECVVNVIDLETDEWHELGPFTRSLFALMQPGAITDDGTIYIATENDVNVAVNLDGEYWSVDAVPSGFTRKMQIASIAADGTMVGWTGKGGYSYPCKVVDGVPEVLPKPEKNFRDEPIGDVQARGISANGKIIYGTTWDNEDYGMIYWDETNTVRWVGHDKREVWEVDRPDGYGGTKKYNLANGMWTTDTRYNVSPNGKWIAGTYRTEELSGDEIIRRNWPAFYNTETQKTTVFEELAGGGGVCVTSDGIGFTTDATFAPNSGSVVDVETGTVLGSVREWVKEKFDITIPGGYIYYYPERGDVIMGAMLWTGGAVLEGVNWYIGPKM